jgi:carbon-monoxide dehydrogenase large subunit
VAVLTGEDLAPLAKPLRAVSKMPGYQITEWPALAVGKVRYVGEAVAVVVARNRYVAEDAAEMIAIEYQPLEPVFDLAAAATPGSQLLHESADSNVLVSREFLHGGARPGLPRAGATDDVTHAATDSLTAETLAVRERFRIRRHAAICIEPRSYVGEFNPGEDFLTLHSTTQCPGVVRSAVAELLGMAENRVRVISIDVGGGFGAKSSVYPEEVAVCAMARMLGRAVKWTSDRREDLMATSQGWDEVIDAELTVKRDGEIVELKAEVIADVGAYSVYPWTACIEPVQTASFLPGPYHVPNYWARASAVATCKAPTGPYRGVGRPISTFVMEGLIERAARRLGLDPVEIRLRNFIRSDEFPYKIPTGIVWDRADFKGTLLKARELLGYANWREQQAQVRQQGRLVGIGFASFVELTGIGSATSAAPGMALPAGTEAATVRVDPSGTVTAIFGVAAHGQGLETTLAQVVADEMGVAMEDVRVVWGDTDAAPYGTGSYASRGAVMGGGAAIMASRVVAEKARRIAAHLLETASPQDASTRTSGAIGGRFESSVSLREVARAAYAGAKRLPKGLEPGLEATCFYDPYYGTASYAAHGAVVEVNPETFATSILAYVVADDCGRMINPLIVDGQVYGGVAQGLGAALLEEVVYEPSGQLMTGSLMDYLIPTATDIPRIVVNHMDIPSPTSLGGFRGVGESGTIGAPAAVANAINDALSQLGIELGELPITPTRIFEYLVARRRGGTPRTSALRQG